MRLAKIVKMPDRGQFLKSWATLAATGSLISDGGQIVSQIVSVTAANGTKAVVLPSALKGMEITVINTDASSTLPVFPYSGDSAAINAGSVDASFVIGAGRMATFVAESKTQWRVAAAAAGTATAAELNVLAGVTAGTVTASKAVVVDANKDIATFRHLTISGNLVTGSTTLSEAELGVVDGVTAGTVIASKAIVVDSGIKASGLLNLTFGAGTATVAPINFVAGTNLTTAAVGAHEFDGTAFYLTAVASARQVVDCEQYTIASSDSATYNNTGLDTAVAAPVFTSTMGGSANGALTVVAGKTYAFEAMYILTNTGTTSHTWSVLFAGGASFTTITYDILGVSGTASTPGAGILTGYATVATAIVATAASTSATENVTIMLKGVFVVNTGGTIIPQMQASARPGASGTPGVVVKKGSYFRCWALGGAGAVGNWS